MDREKLRRGLREQLEKDTGAKYEKLEDSQKLREDLGLDSVDVVSLIVYLQAEYGIELETEELEGVERVGELLDRIEKHIASKKCAA